MNILFADSNAFRRFGFMVVFKRIAPEVVMLEASDNDTIFRLIKKNDIPIIVLYVNKIDQSSQDLIRDVKLSGNKTSILLVTETREELFPSSFFKSRADGLIDTSASINEFEKVFKTFFKQRKYIPNYLKEAAKRHSSSHLRITTLKLSKVLSEREQIVFKLLARGSTLSDIASDLDLKASTVRTYKVRIFKKLQVSNDRELYELADRARFIA